MRATTLIVAGWALAACDGGAAIDADAARSDDAPAADAPLVDGPEVDGPECEARPGAPCDCAPTAPGQGGRLVPSRPVFDVAADPVRCRVYALGDGAVLVFDTRAKRELPPIPIPTGVRDLAVAADGSVVAVGLGTGGIAVIDPRSRTMSALIPTTGDVERLAVEATRAFYVTKDQWSQGHRVDLASGGDSTLRTNLCYECDIVLADDGQSLVAATSRLSSPIVERFGVAGTAFGLLDSSGFLSVSPSADRWAVLSSDRTRLYFARSVIDAGHLMTVQRATDERILAEDSARGIAIGTGHAYDVVTGAPIGTHPRSMIAATLVSDGAELWALESTAQVRYVATADLRAP